MRLRSIGIERAGIAMFAVLVGTALAWADCVDGVMRDTTPAERAVWDRVSKAVPALLRPPADYESERSNIGVSRERRCALDAHAPFFVPVHLSYRLKKEGEEALVREEQGVLDEMLAVQSRFRARWRAIQARNSELMRTFPKNPQDRVAMAEFEKKEQALEQARARLEQEQEQAMAPLEARQARLAVRREIKADAIFNASSADCPGERVAISGAVASCMEQFDDGSAKLTALFGAWVKGEGRWWKAAFDPAAPSQRLQTLELSVTAAGGAPMDAMLRNIDWQAMAALLGAGE